MAHWLGAIVLLRDCLNNLALASTNLGFYYSIAITTWNYHSHREIV